ncbi:hypothetical protein GJV07_22670 [Enterobacteriaceae bacterium RIT711]|nr:hypothetical protein [Enterobacteriaceae bacterium RIT711]
MSKLKDCQFIEIKIDNKLISGSSEEKDYKQWMEGFVQAGLSTMAGPDGTYFDSVNLSILATKESSSLFENYLQRGYNDISFTIVHRASDKYSKNYEAQRTVYNTCNIQRLDYEMREHLFINLSFSFEGTLEVTFNVPNDTETGLDKIGPIKYDIPKKELL